MKPLVSIIVPVFNTAAYVEECVLSLLAQSYANIEVILVNDGSTDDSGDVCQKYASSANVCYVEQAHEGVVAARKRGVEAAHGEWIMFVDSDDLLTSDAVEQLVALSSGVDIVVGRPENGDYHLLKAPAYYSRNEYLYKLYAATDISSSPWAKLYSKKLFENNEQAFYYHIVRSEDYLMNLAVATRNEKEVAICKRPVYIYRYRAGSAILTHKCSFDFCQQLCETADAIVAGHLPAKESLLASISCRMYYFRKCLIDSDYQSDKHHPFVKGIIQKMNQAGVLRCSDRMVLGVSSRRAVKCCMVLAKFVRRMEHPSLFLKDYSKLIRKNGV